MRTHSRFIPLVLGVLGAIPAFGQNSGPDCGDPHILSRLGTACWLATPAFQTPLPRLMGLEPSGNALVYVRFAQGLRRPIALSAGQAEKIASFLRDAGLSPELQEATLRQTALRALENAGLQPHAVTPDGTSWFDGTSGTLHLTNSGKRAVPAILLGDPFGSIAADVATAVQGSPTHGERLQGLLAGIPGVNFDNAARRGELANAAVVPGASAGRGLATPLGAMSSVPAKAGVPPPAADQETKASPDKEKIFKRSQGLFHLAWLSDLFFTRRMLAGGGRELNPLYTRFGAKNVAGVLLSMLGFHLLLSWLAWRLFRWAGKQAGATRENAENLAIAVTLGATLTHLHGMIHNIRLIPRLKDR